MALELCKWLEEKEPENYIHVINRIQCEIRLREISDSEIAELMEILKQILINKARPVFRY